MSTIVGNDISTFQGQVDFDTYKNNSNFVIIKATEGVGFTDPQFTRNQSESRRIELARGYYHFAHADLGNSPQEEADYFLSVVGQLQSGEVLALDFECAYTGDIVGWCKGFLDEVYAKTNVRALIYLNQALATGNDFTSIVNAGYGLWLASYTGNPTVNDGQTGKWPFMAMQQWTNSETVPGITGGVDGDVFFGDIATFQKYGYVGTPQGTYVDATTFTQLVTKASAFDEFVKGGYNSISDVTTKVQGLQSQIDSITKQVGELTTTNQGLTTALKQSKDTNSNLLGQMQQMEQADSTAIDNGLKTDSALKIITTDMTVVATELHTTYPPVKNLTSAIQSLQNEITTQQVVNKQSAKVAQSFLAQFITLFINWKKR